jgi:(heptosyl)LPS beta-1,4-glucosyltransferase
MSISAIVIAKDAEKIIEKTLKSVQFADEIILVDIKSKDDTVIKAKKLASRIYKFPKDSRFVEPVRNFALEKSNKDWILVLDADEEIPPTLAEELIKVSQNPEKEAYYLPRKNIVFKKWMQHTAWWPDYQLRFFKKGVITWSEEIHAQPLLNGKEVKRENVAILENKEDLAIIHHNYDSVKEYLERFNRYTDIEAEQKKTENFSISATALFKTFKDDLFTRFFKREGYKDGAHGLYLSIAQGLYQMTTQMKIWGSFNNDSQLEKTSQEELINTFKEFQKELDFWIKDLEIKEKKGLAKIWAQLKRKIGL